MSSAARGKVGKLIHRQHPFFNVQDNFTIASRIVNIPETAKYEEVF